MADPANNSAEIGWLDRLASQDSPLHRLDPRSKLITTLAFAVTVMSYGKYQVAALLPLLAYPLVLMSAGGIPARFIIRKLLAVSPLAILLGLFNPLLDRSAIVAIGSMQLAGGWVSYASILVRFALTVAATLAMIAVTGIHNICRGLDRLGVPAVFTVQVLMLYRYLFVLVDEARRMTRARALRSAGGRGMGLRVYGAMLGSLLLRTLDRAQRVHDAMCCRGFSTTVQTAATLRLRPGDALFMAGWLTYFVLARLVDLPRLAGAVLSGGWL